MAHPKMNTENMTSNLGEIILYQTEDGRTALDVYLKDETVWLTLNQMCDLFDRDKSVISRHLCTIFKSGELDHEATVAKNATVQIEGGRKVTRDIDYYNMDAIISIGYRVNSKRGTQFRIWATSILKNHLIKGYTLNQKRLAEKGINEAQQVLTLLADTLESHNLVTDEGRLVLDIVNRYAKTWRLLFQFDEEVLPIPETRHDVKAFLDLEEARQAIAGLKKELMIKKEATEIFGQERDEGLAGIIGAVYQTFGGYDLYPGIEEKAANLLYFVIKDHPFTDGNKRIGSFIFLLFLKINGLLDARSFDNKALVALALLIATSDPGQKDLLIRLIVNLISEK